jgi:hypothetical protein
LQPIANKNASNTYLEKKSAGTYGWSTNSNTRNLLAKDSTGAYGFANISFLPPFVPIMTMTVNTGTTNTFIVPISQHSGGTSQFASYNVTIDWGDGNQTSSSGNASNNAGISHTYSAPGTYTIGINGSNLAGIGFSSGVSTSNAAANKAKLIAVSGNMSDAAFGTGAAYSSYQRFYDCKALVDASGLTLPSRTMLDHECYYMFEGCTALTKAPTLPSLTAGTYCYTRMFGGNTSLVTPPAVPATTLATLCYNAMFTGCSALKTAPTLPALTAVAQCYLNMFYNCTSLTTAPILPATTVSTQSYSYMFYNCSNMSGTLNIGISTATATALGNQALSSMCQLSTAPAAGKGITAITGHANFIARFANTITMSTGGTNILTNQIYLNTPRSYDNLLSGWK